MQLTAIYKYLLLFILIGCAKNNQPEKINVDLPTSFSVEGSLVPPEFWWKSFQIKGLDNCIQESLFNNLSLKIAWQRFLEAEALAKKSKADLFPNLSLEAEAQFSKPDSSNRDRYALGLNASYELDLLGKIRNKYKSESYIASASFADYKATALSLSAEIALVWFRIAEAKSQIELIHEQISTNQQVLKVIENRIQTGQSSSVDVLRQKNVIVATQGKLISFELRLKILEHQLMILLGKPPNSKQIYSPMNLPNLPAFPKLGLPSDVINRRPDVISALYSVQSTDKELSVAIRDKYPKFTISALILTSGFTPSDLFKEWTRTFIGSLVMPIFEAGKRKAEVERVRAIKERTFLEYSQIVLKSLQEVEDSLINEVKQNKILLNLNEQLEISKKVNEQLFNKYANGTINYIDILLQIKEQHELESKVLTEKLQLLEYRISLYRAIAGGFTINKEKKE